MYLLDRRQARDNRAELANTHEVCMVLEMQLEALYRLAFLLTANHDEAERCFLAAIGKQFDTLPVFKDWIESRTKYRIIKQAVRVVFADGAQQEPVRHLWLTESGGRQVSALDRVTALPALERFAFVLCILEGHSTRGCAALLGRGTESVLKAKREALLRLPKLAREMALSQVEPVSTESIAYAMIQAARGQASEAEARTSLAG